jgi:hypothetical protein
MLPICFFPARAKRDAERYLKTGGGPKPSTTNAAEEAILQAMEGRPGLEGLDNFTDSSDLGKCTGNKINN